MNVLIITDKGQSLFGAGNDDIADIKSVHHIMCRNLDSPVFIMNRFRKHLIDFFKIRRNIVRISVLCPVCSLGIHNNRYTTCMTGLNDLTAIFSVQAPFP